MLSLLVLASAGSGTAQTVSTDPVGFVSVTVKANSDATIAVPLNRTAAFKGVIQSISGSTITVAGTPNWAANQFVQSIGTQNETYAVQLATGTKEGLTAKVTQNGTNTLTLQLTGGDDLSGVKSELADGAGNGDQLDVMPFWTPSSLFSTVPPVGFVISGFSAATPGVNSGSTEIYAHAGSNVWEDGITSDDATYTTLNFGSALVVRNNSGSDYTLSMVGAVPMSAQRIRISTKAGNTPQDNAIGYMSPIPEALSTIGDPSVQVGNQSPNALGFPAQVGDSIVGFDNSQSGINKGASEIYTWNGSAWEDDILGGEIDYTVKLKPGFGYVYRKAATPSPVSVVWTHVQSYLQ